MINDDPLGDAKRMSRVKNSTRDERTDLTIFQAQVTFYWLLTYLPSQYVRSSAFLRKSVFSLSTRHQTHEDDDVVSNFHTLISYDLGFEVCLHSFQEYRAVFTWLDGAFDSASWHEKPRLL